MSGFSSVGAAVEAVARGDVVIVVDAEDRENEGDLVCAAERITPETMNLVMDGRGIPCMPVLPDVARRLQLGPIVSTNTAPLGTAFLTPIDHRSASTGITAEERACTVRAAADPASHAEDFVRPGHVFPLLAKEGGVLRRAGHTEATVDLARMAGLLPAGVLCEILDPSGRRASREQLFGLAERRGLEIISIDQLIAHRRTSERLVSRATEAELPTPYGSFRLIVYDVKYESHHPMVLVLGDPGAVAAPLVRLHSAWFPEDLVSSLQRPGRDDLHAALDAIGSEGCGVLVYLTQERTAADIARMIAGGDRAAARAHQRDYGIGIQILKDLDLRRVRILTNKPKKADAAIFSAFDLELVDQVPVAPPLRRRVSDD